MSIKNERHKIKQIKSDKTYWDYISSSKENEEHLSEPVIANPDSLTDELHNKPWGNKLSKVAQVLIDEYMNEQGEFDILSKQENQALRLYTSGLSLGEVALEMGISKSSVVVYIGRISVKFRRLLKSLEGTL